MTKEYKVYRYTFPDGMVYVGVTSLSLEQRRDNGYNHNQNLKNAIRTSGWKNVKKDILATSGSQDEAFRLEMDAIAKYDATNPERGYNISLGGKSTYAGLRHSEEYKKRMSKMYTGKKYTEETLLRMRSGHAKERKKVLRVGKDGTKKKYESLGNAADDVCGHKSNISRACSSGKQYKGYFWTFDNGEEAIVG